ncbi:Chromosome initiation inhibitor [Leucobacter sp. 7(1)]|uniref:LysR family transcriptional regulator n=1 Tax=Leucobacter sp. 7(1) TaxID=1255613 RepID=UPI00097E99B8|nr:LysR family transcriptional regulator [Leucobacter sp. 7(1)]SJN12979.1 Chromosome initiation inhibitor [Leucobacter sp. 7(1)]
MDTRRLTFLLELSRLGSMRAVADVLGTSTSTVSQQIAVLAHEFGTELIFPAGRGVRLTPAGRRLAEHAATILAEVQRARLDLDPAGEPSGTVRVAGFAGAVRRTVLPVVRELTRTHPAVSVEIHEYEPREALDFLASDTVDVALTYDYDLAPMPESTQWHTTPLWETPWGLGVPSPAPAVGAGAPVAAPDRPLSAYQGHTWIGNSRNTADEDALRILASLEGFPLRITHKVDNIELAQELIRSGMGVGLLPADRKLLPGVTLLPLRSPGVTLRAFVHARSSRDTWPALALVRDRIIAHARAGASQRELT